MEQSVVSSPVNVGPGNAADRTWKSVLASLWLSLKGLGRQLVTKIRYFRHPAASDLAAAIDVDQISARLGVDNRGRSDGSKEQPASNEQALSGTQREIIAHFKELQRRAQHRFTELADKLRALGQEIDLPEAIANLRDIPSRCENDVLRFTAEFQSQLNFLGEREAQLHKHKEASHDKDQTNDDEDSQGTPIVHLAATAVLLSAGAVAIGKVSASGFGGDALLSPVKSISLALPAVLVPFVLARMVSRSVNDVAPLRQLMGWLVGAATFAFIGSLAVFSAHYLAAMSVDPGVAVRAAIDSMLAAPTGVTMDQAIWMGSGIVLGIGLLAYLFGYGSDSPYSGYGSNQRAIIRVRSERDRLTKRLRAHLNEIVDQADVDVTMQATRLKKQIRQYARLLNESNRIPENLRRYDVALEDACNILLDRYRAANASTRQTDVPKSFSDRIEFRPAHESMSSLFADETGRLNEFNEGIAEFDNEVVQVRQRLRDLNWRSISSLDE
jgi:hypothetical protein